MLGWLVAGMLAAHAGDWAQQPIDPESNPDGTAYTLGPRTWRVGLVKQQVGVLDNLDLGTRLPLWVFGAANAHAKVRAISVGRFDVALDGEIIAVPLGAIGVPEGRMTVYPAGWTASGRISDRFSLHGGTGWTVAKAEGRLGGQEIANAVAAVTGADISETLAAELGNTGLYAGANLTLFQTRLQVEYRMNHRDSLVVRSNTWVYLDALVAAGIDTTAGDGGTEVQAGASARVRVPLDESLQSLTTVAWQFNWRRARLRLGMPLPLNNSFAWLQAVDFYVLLGKGRAAPPPQPVDAG